jgi:hypothetical protein
MTYRELPLGKSCIAVFTPGELTVAGLSPAWDDPTLHHALLAHPDLFQRGIARGKAFRRSRTQRHRERQGRATLERTLNRMVGLPPEGF